MFKEGDKAKVINHRLESYGLIGTVIDTYIEKYPNSVLIEFKEWNGQYDKTLYINKENLKKVGEDINMEKLTGYKFIAVINQGYGTKYHYAIFEDGIEYKVGDKVVVSGVANNTIHKISEILTVEQAAERYKGQIKEEVIGIIDMSAYEERLRVRKEADILKREMDKKIKEMLEVDRYEMYAKQNPELRDMLDKYKKLVG